MCWMKQADRAGHIVWTTKHFSGQPDCRNYRRIPWDDVTLKCQASGKFLCLSDDVTSGKYTWVDVTLNCVSSGPVKFSLFSCSSQENLAKQ